MKLSSLFKSQKKSCFSPLLCRLPHCGNPKTLSFRLENNHNIFNSQSFRNKVDDYMVEKVIEGLKIEKGRFFFEAREKNISILELSSLARTNNNNSGNELEFLPFNDSCVITLMDLMNPYGGKISSILEGSSSALSKGNNSGSGNGLDHLPFDDSCELLDPMDSYGEKTSSILEGTSSTLSKSNNSGSSNGLENLSFNDSCVIKLLDLIDPNGKKTSSILEVSNSNNSSSSNMLEYLPSNDSSVITLMDLYGKKTNSTLEGSSSALLKSIDSTSNNELKNLPFNDSCVITLSSSGDPYGNFMASMIKMIESNRENKDWEESIEEILGCYLEINEKQFHKHIIGAFCDLWVIYSSPSTANIRKALDNSPFSFNTSNPPSPHFLSLIETKVENTTTISSVISPVVELDRVG